MGLPNDTLSSTPIQGFYLYPDNQETENLLDYEHGGIAIGDASSGSQFQVWTLTYVDPNVILTPENAGPTTVLSIAGLKEASLSFDQNMNPTIAYVTSTDAAELWWFSTVDQTYLQTPLPAGSITPRVCLDDKRDLQSTASDILLAYVRDDKLYYRYQRERYDNEYWLADLDAGQKLVKIGMSQQNRIQFWIL